MKDQMDPNRLRSRIEPLVSYNRFVCCNNGSLHDLFHWAHFSRAQDAFDGEAPDPHQKHPKHPGEAFCLWMRHYKTIQTLRMDQALIGSSSCWPTPRPWLIRVSPSREKVSLNFWALA